MKKILFILILIICCNTVYSQENKSRVVYQRIIDGDTLYVLPLDEIEVKSKYIRKKRHLRRTNRLIRYVKKVYPYAKLAGQKLIEYDSLLKNAETNSQRRKLMRQAEDEIKEEYGDELKKLTFSQGKILLLLIDRETGDTSYELVKDLRGSFSAFFYQTFARIFGFNLKIQYDPNGKHRMIEEIVRLIEKGEL